MVPFKTLCPLNLRDISPKTRYFFRNKKNRFYDSSDSESEKEEREEYNHPQEEEWSLFTKQVEDWNLTEKRDDSKY